MDFIKEEQQYKLLLTEMPKWGAGLALLEFLCSRGSKQPRVPFLKTIQRKHGKVKWGLCPILQNKIIFLLDVFDVPFPPLPLSLFSSITSLLPYSGMDNSRLPSLSQEPLPYPEVAFLQTAPPCSAWRRQHFRGQQFSNCLPSFPFWPTFNFLIPWHLPPWFCCSCLLVLGVPNFS